MCGIIYWCWKISPLGDGWSGGEVDTGTEADMTGGFGNGRTTLLDQHVEGE